jgi:hypothetical protein
MAQLRQAEVLGDQAEQELEQAEAERDALMDDVQSTGKLWHEAESRAEKAEVALRTLLDKLERVEASEAYRSVWIVAQIHAGPYHGENWAVERAAARAALRDTAPAHLSTEAEALAVMGAGQKLTKLREIEKP